MSKMKGSERLSKDESSTTLLLKVEDLINIAMGPAEYNVVNFKMLQTVLFILARQMRLLEQKVELRVNELSTEAKSLHDQMKNFGEPILSEESEGEGEVGQMKTGEKRRKKSPPLPAIAGAPFRTDEGREERDRAGRDAEDKEGRGAEKKSRDALKGRETDRDGREGKRGGQPGERVGPEGRESEDYEEERGRGHRPKEGEGRRGDRDDYSPERERGRRGYEEDRDRGRDGDRSRDRGGYDEDRDRGRDGDRSRERKRGGYDEDRDRGRDGDRSRERERGGYDDDRDRGRGADRSRERDRGGYDEVRDRGKGGDHSRERDMGGYDDERDRGRGGDRSRERERGGYDEDRDRGRGVDRSRERDRGGYDEDRDRGRDRGGHDEDRDRGRAADRSRERDRGGYDDDRDRGRDGDRSRERDRGGYDEDRDRGRGADRSRERDRGGYDDDRDRGRDGDRSRERDRGGYDEDRDRGRGADRSRERDRSGYDDDRDRRRDGDRSRERDRGGYDDDRDRGRDGDRSKERDRGGYDDDRDRGRDGDRSRERDRGGYDADRDRGRGADHSRERDRGGYDDDRDRERGTDRSRERDRGGYDDDRDHGRGADRSGDGGRGGYDEDRDRRGLGPDQYGEDRGGERGRGRYDERDRGKTSPVEYDYEYDPRKYDPDPDEEERRRRAGLDRYGDDRSRGRSPRGRHDEEGEGRKGGRDDYGTDRSRERGARGGYDDGRDRRAGPDQYDYEYDASKYDQDPNARRGRPDRYGPDRSRSRERRRSRYVDDRDVRREGPPDQPADRGGVQEERGRRKPRPDEFVPEEERPLSPPGFDKTGYHEDDGRRGGRYRDKTGISLPRGRYDEERDFRRPDRDESMDLDGDVADKEGRDREHGGRRGGRGGGYDEYGRKVDGGRYDQFGREAYGPARSSSSLTATEFTKDGEKILSIGKRKSSGGTPTKVGSIEVVTRSQFQVLENAVRELQDKTSLPPAPRMPDNERLIKDIEKGTASLTDTMQAMQLSARVQAAEKAISNMAELITQLAATGAVPKDVVEKAKDIREDVKAMKKDITKQVQKSRFKQEPQAELDREERRSRSPPSPAELAPPASKISLTLPQLLPVEKPKPAPPPPPVVEVRPPSFVGVSHAEMDEELAFLRDDLIKNMTLMTHKTMVAADSAAANIKKIADQMDIAINLDNRITLLQAVVADYAEQLAGFDTGLLTQIQNFQEQMAVLREQLAEGLLQLENVNNNAETAAVMELTERYNILVNELDTTMHAHQGLTMYQRQLASELNALQEAVEQMREEKADRDEVLDGLRDKADASKLKGLLTEEEFQRSRDDLETRMQMCYDKFRRQDGVWMNVISDFTQITESKAELMQLLRARDEAQEQLQDLHRKVQILTRLLGDPKAAILTRMVSKDGNCAVCRLPAVMNPLEPMPPIELPEAFKTDRPHPGVGEDPTDTCLRGFKLSELAEEPSKELESHICLRWVGGSHTLVGPGVGRGHVTKERAPPFTAASRPCVRKYAGYGVDGKLYQFEEDLEPCVECNLFVEPEKLGESVNVPGEKIPGEADLPGITCQDGGGDQGRRVTLVDPTSARRVTVVDEEKLERAPDTTEGERRYGDDVYPNLAERASIASRASIMVPMDIEVGSTVKGHVTTMDQEDLRRQSIRGQIRASRGDLDPKEMLLDPAGDEGDEKADEE